MRRGWTILIRAAFGAALAAVLGFLLLGHRAPADQPPLVTLDPGSLHLFRAAFNDAAVRARLVLLLSPT